MKFGTQLQDAIYPEWQEAYIDYDGLKKKLRKAERDNPFSEKDETIFVELLDNNLEKVYAFHQEKMEDIRARLDYWSETIATQLPSENNIEEMGQIQDNINNIADDINRLAKYSRINYTGFLKIVKKHDRHTKYVLRPMFMVRLNQCPFWNEDNDALLLKLSQLFAQVRQGGKQMSFQPSSSFLNNKNTIYTEHQPHQANKKIVVKRYFVQKENVLELKTYVLRHLPVLVYRDNSGKKENIDPPISSLYLDNADLDIYNSRVELAQGSQIIRIRWYGTSKRNNAISIERRTLSEESCGELKDKFTIKDKYITDFLQGGHAYIDKYTKKLRDTPGKTEEDVEKYTSLVNQVQKYIMDNKLQPVLRTYYKRTAFQIPGDKSVRMALDTDLCFIREDSNMFDKVTRIPEEKWCRPDVDTQYPFPGIEDTDINRYPFATFEIKLELQAGESEPEWVTDLQESGILEETADFSKFVHGVAVMFDTRVALLPYWLAQMGDDLNELPILPSQSPSVVTKTHKDLNPVRSPSTEDQPVNESTSLLNNNNSDNRNGPSSSTYTTFPRLHELEPNSNNTTDNSSLRPNFIQKFITFTQHLFFGNDHQQQQSQQQRQQNQSPIILPPGVKVPKKVITPLRVEPKVFFANERTYFSWMSFGTLMATFSIALFNGGDAVGKISGVIYTLISLSTLLYGMGLYYRRRELICQRAAGPYDDLTGPTIICFALLFAVGLNAYLKFTSHHPSLHNL
ncbi:VTC domain-containing protein [Cunninghamella echinulata]|nr:VTC domain-containing protein [Cunninghamella echinulata]